MSLSMYKDLQMQERMEVVMVSMDRDAGDFQDYLLQTPFLALPHHRRDIAKDLWKRYEVKKIPTLVFIDHHGQVIEREGRRMIENNFMDLRAVWKHLLGDNVFANDAWHPAQPHLHHARHVTVVSGSQQGRQPTSNAPRRRPLEGIRVVECGHLIAGPFAGTILSYFGAEVIKVEPPSGDQVRDYRELDSTKTSLWWYSIGRNKHSVSIDIKQEEGRALIRELIDSSDVLIENFKPGRMEKWGLGPEAFEQSNPGLVYTRVSGFGQDGPYSSRPGFASVCEAMGGFRYVNGFPDRPPVRQNLSLGDTVAGIHAALGTVIALLGRERDAQRLGQTVDVAIYESMFNLLEAVVPEYDYAGVVRECSGSTITGIVPSNTYTCLGGKNIVIAANTDTLFVKLMRAIGHSEMADDPKYRTNADRVKFQDEIDNAVSSWTATRPLDDVVRAMEAAQVPVGLVFSVEDMMRDAHYLHRNMFEEVHIPAADAHTTRPLRVPAILPKLEGTPGETKWAGRRLGEDTRHVLRSILRRSDADIDQLVQARSVFEPPTTSA
ncbi:TPA: hypothetical protein N0F65_002010 [Lagenidium giganteum]|uniref:Thioredoxin-like fold domain-containing protein n=1 Tax=Lagenidium giganteum TaxID=4803 RepID=A0AAV2Z017_9STRA|nr:TPA: hypothetical protein N0F65_002010 [Lagenidium giganteum]